MRFCPEDGDPKYSFINPQVSRGHYRGHYSYGRLNETMCREMEEGSVVDKVSGDKRERE